MYVYVHHAAWAGTEHFPGWNMKSKHEPSQMNTEDSELREAANERVHVVLNFQRLSS